METPSAAPGNTDSSSDAEKRTVSLNHAPTRASWHIYGIVFSLALPNFAAAFDSTALPVVLPVITKELNGTTFQAFWLGTSFLITSTVIPPISCLTADIVGRKITILLSLCVFILGSALAAASNGLPYMLAGRSIQGAGAGSITSLSGVLLADLIELRKRGKWSGVLNSTYTLGTVCGPLLAASLTESLSWRWICWINVPLAGVAFVMLAALLRFDFQTTHLRTSLQGADYIGIGIFMPSLTAFIVATSWGGVIYSWGSWRTVIPLILGAVGLVVFMTYEIYMAQKPFIPPTIFDNRSTRINFGGQFAFGFVLWALLYYLVLYYQGIKEYGILFTGVAILPETVTIVVVGIVAAVAISLSGRYRLLLWSGWTLTTIGIGLLLQLKVDTTIAGWVVPNTIIGVGAGMAFPAIQIGIQASSPEKTMAMSVAMMSTFQNLGRTAGVAVGGVVLQNRLEHYLQLEHYLAAAASDSDYASLIPQLVSQIAGGSHTEILKTAFLKSLAGVWWCLFGVSALSLVSSLFVLPYSLGKGSEGRMRRK